MDFISQMAGSAGELGTTIAAFMFVLVIVVFFHEFGHFWVGRRCGIKVDAFSIGFGPELFSHTDRKGTRWRVALLPLGGYVKFHGDINGASQPDPGALAAMPDEAYKQTFAAQPIWKRAATVAAGPAANFLLAIAIFAASFYFSGRPVLIPRIEKVETASAAEAAGLKAGDLVRSIDGRGIDSFDQLVRTVMGSAGRPLALEVERDGKLVSLGVTPGTRDIKTAWRTYTVGSLGVRASTNPNDQRVDFPGPVDSVGLAAAETWSWVERTGAFVSGIVSGRESAGQVSGPIGIAAVSGATAKLGIGALLLLAAILSISVGLINLVPIPLLDGGHLMYFAIEAVRGKPLSEKSQEMGFRVGLAVVGTLMLLATSNDLINLVSKWTGHAG
jgi:regulator of sigma E protease